MFAVDDLPQSVDGWRRSNHPRVRPQDIRNYNSGSKFERDHYLALRILWSQTSHRSMIPSRYLSTAAGILQHSPQWRSYCEAIANVTLSLSNARGRLGEFTTVLLNQRSCFYIKDNHAARDDVEKVLGTPLKERLRHQDLRPTYVQSPSTPTRQAEPSLLDPDYAVTGSGAHDTASDEQIVNTALVLLLQTLSLQSKDTDNANWSLIRQRFVFYDKGTVPGIKGTKLYESRTDGVLQLRNNDRPREQSLPKIILEVKARRRVARDPSIRLQEASELFAWIYQHKPRVEIGKLPEDVVYQRYIIAQDMDQIWIIQGRFTQAYLRFVHGQDAVKDPELSTEHFLAVTEFGPWMISNAAHMEELGPILLGLTLLHCDLGSLDHTLEVENHPKPAQASSSTIDDAMRRMTFKEARRDEADTVRAGAAANESPHGLVSKDGRTRSARIEKNKEKDRDEERQAARGKGRRG